MLALLIISCNKDDSDPDVPSGPLSINHIETGKFWGDELVITGTGFSPVAEENVVKFLNVTAMHLCEINYTSDGGDIEIVSATETKLTIIVPGWKPTGEYLCGPTAADIEISVNSNTAVSEDHTFGQIPYLEGFNYHYGWFDLSHMSRVGDSVLIDAGLRGANQLQSPYWNDLRLSINDKSVPFKYRTIGGESGLAFYLPVSEYAETNCTTEPDDWGAREMKFTLSIRNTNKSASRNLYVQYYPEQASSCAICPANLSKSEGGNPFWRITGKNMSYNEAIFTPIACSGTPQGVTITAGAWVDELQFSIPLSILSIGCTYAVTLSDGCKSVLIGNVEILP